MRKQWKLFALAAALLMPLSAGAEEPAHIASSVYDVVEDGAEWSSSSYLDESGGEASEESTFYVNDGFDRLTEFHMTREGDLMSLTIRQNGVVVWKGSTHVKQHTFSVMRRDRMGEVYFEIHMGEHVYHASVDKNDKWDVSEEVPSRQPVPLEK